MAKIKLLIVLLVASSQTFAQKNDSIFIRKIYDQALSFGQSYENLRSLCKDVGARLSGSSEAEMAVEWGRIKLQSYNFDKVYLQEIQVPHWERGTKESAWVKTKEGKLISLKILALGGSIGTNGTLRAELVIFNSLEDLKKAKESEVKGKIVLLNQPFDEKIVNTFRAYGACYPIRGDGAVEAAKLGAVGVVVRSLGSSQDLHPHTGSMHYDEKINKIPAAAIATQQADLLVDLSKNQKLEFIFELDCKSLPDVKSYNVIGEMTGTEFPNEIITFGGHLDSWDAGEGAHDDGAGIIHSIEALRILKALNFKPKHTLRVVLFMNEENGNKGGLTYATWSKEKGEKQIAALESDRGGFAPRGFSCDGNKDQVALLQSFQSVFEPYELHVFEKGYGGVDINPLKNSFEGIPLFGFVPDSQRYFDFHHTESDVFESVNKRELELGCAAVSSMIYLLDSYIK
jgi:Zn-dependent M28 family amino/carboxypeptidase